MVYIRVKKNNIEYALRLFKRKIKDGGLMVELRERQHYTKPSVKRATKKKLRKNECTIKCNVFSICVYLYSTQEYVIHSYMTYQTM